jgi:glycine cleavage system transcriptional repressor
MHVREGARESEETHVSEFAVAALGEDRPGIVAAASEALVAAGASIEDSSMTILGGHFAMLLLVRGELAGDALDAALQPVAERFQLQLTVRPTAQHARGEERRDHVIAAYGADRPGLVAAMARVLADADVNIADFGSRVGSSETGAPVFAMWFNVSIPPDADVDALTQRLRDAGGEVALDVTVHPAAEQDL